MAISSLSDYLGTKNSLPFHSFTIINIFHSHIKHKETIELFLSFAQTLQRAPMISCCSPLGSTLLSPHEALIRSLLNKPFRVPIAGYTGGGFGRSLGVRRAGGRQPLHDPEAENALVLYWPRDLSEHEKLKTDVSRAEVAVVVDPLLSR